MYSLSSRTDCVVFNCTGSVRDTEGTALREALHELL